MNIQATPALLASTIQSVRRAIGGNTDRGRDLGYVEALANHVDELMKRVDEIADRLSPPTERNGRSVTIAAREHATADDLVKLMSGCGDEWCHELADLPAPGLAARLHYTLHGAWDDLRLARVARAEAERDAEEQAQWKPQLDEANARIRSQMDAIVETRKVLLGALGIRWAPEDDRTAKKSLAEVAALVAGEISDIHLVDEHAMPDAAAVLAVKPLRTCHSDACQSLAGDPLTEVVRQLHDEHHLAWDTVARLRRSAEKMAKRLRRL